MSNFDEEPKISYVSMFTPDSDMLSYSAVDIKLAEGIHLLHAKRIASLGDGSANSIITHDLLLNKQ